MDPEDQVEALLASTDDDTERQREPVIAPAPAPVPAPESADIAATFSLFKDYLDIKLVSLKEDLKEDAQNTTDSVAKKLKETSELTFKFEGNKQQHKFNRGLADQVSVALKALERKKTSKANDCLKELEKQIKRRNKLIRLADKSPAGWDLVNEYLSDELASGSEDEKRIRKAEQAALRKRTNKQRGRTQRPASRPHPYTSTSTFTSSNANQPFQYQHPSTYRSTFQRFGVKKAAPTDICFACGIQGHWRADCRRVPIPFAKANQASTSRQHTAGGNQ